MELKDLKNELTQKENLAKRTEVLYHQIHGQLELLHFLIKTEENNIQNENKKENNS